MKEVTVVTLATVVTIDSSHNRDGSDSCVSSDNKFFAGKKIVMQKWKRYIQIKCCDLFLIKINKRSRGGS